MSFQDILDALKTTAGDVVARSGVDLSTPRIQSEAWAIAVSEITGTQWAAGYDSTKQKYSVYPKDINAARRWVADQAKKTSAVNIDWWPSIAPVAIKQAAPLALGVFVAGMIVGYVVHK